MYDEEDALCGVYNCSIKTVPSWREKQMEESVWYKLVNMD